MIKEIIGGQGIRVSQLESGQTTISVDPYWAQVQVPHGVMRWSNSQKEYWNGYGWSTLIEQVSTPSLPPPIYLNNSTEPTSKEKKVLEVLKALLSNPSNAREEDEDLVTRAMYIAEVLDRKLEGKKENTLRL